MSIDGAVRQRIQEASAKPKHLAAARVLEGLASEHRVLRWFEKNHGELKAQSASRTAADQAWALAQWVADRQPLTPWELLPTAERKRRLGRIDSLATDLAKLLHQADSPAVPSAIDLFQLDRLPPHWSQLGLWQADVWRLRRQKLAPMLARLARFARNERGSIDKGLRRQARPLTGDANRRALVREIAGWFQRQYRTAVNAEVVADIVNVAAPDPGASFDGKKVRQCLSGK